MQMWRRVLAGFVPLLLIASCGGDGETASEPTTTTVEVTTTSTEPAEEIDSITAALTSDHTSVVARADVDEVAVYAEPDDTSEMTMAMPRNPPAYLGEDGSTVDQVFLVEEYDDPWLKVLLPVRPNGTTGWIRLDDVTVSKHTYEIVVELGAHRMITSHDGEMIQEAAIAVGTQDTPTPGGRFFLNALLTPPNPNTIYGTHAYALSGYSDTLEYFAGGDGVIGIHGTNDPSVVGSDVSHGCIRMSNQDIQALVDKLPLGTPVEIRP